MTETARPPPSPPADDLADRIDAAVASLKRLWLAAKAQDSTAYSWGERLRFVVDGSGAAHLGDGWYAPEPDRTWTAGGVAQLLFSTGPASSRVRLRALLSPFLPRETESQRVVVQVRAARVAEWSIADTGWQQAEIPPNLVNSHGAWSLSLVPACAGSPHEANGSDDHRSLGVALHELTLETINDSSESCRPVA